ncbi:unnamed protein product [Polarella glacialis]|uniref:Uncharacterized protein n=2 Tax=Polarella glacialis TaxID=89957 RepID=A0A813HEH2_POLGL|nr:unnamed protein product [Polarella glacialis]
MAASASLRAVEGGPRLESGPATFSPIFLLLVASCVCLVIVVLRALARRCAVPRGRALRRMTWRDLCLLRSERLAAWPSLALEFEAARGLWHSQTRIAAVFPRRAAAPSFEELRRLIGEATRLEDLGNASAARDVAWDLCGFCNDAFFGGELQVDDICFVPAASEGGGAAGRQLESEAAEAVLRCTWNADLTKATLRIEFAWSHARRWTLARLTSVLLHELVHAWHDSAHWPRAEQCSMAHSTDFLAKCLLISDDCLLQDLPFFPNVFTESWALIVAEDLAQLLGSAAAALRRGSLIEDLLAAGLSPTEASAVKLRLNTCNIRRALEIGYDELRSWRRVVGTACMQHLACSHETPDCPDIFVRGDYVIAPRAFLLKVAAQDGRKQISDALLGGVPHLFQQQHCELQQQSLRTN